MRELVKQLLLLPFFIFASYLLSGQNVSMLKNFLTVEDGLSQNEVTSIIQDKDGFMWFGTRGGLNRYDAYEFIHYKPKANAQNHISNPSIETIFEDSKGNLWIGTKSGGLNHYNSLKEKFTRVTSFGETNEQILDDRIICLAETNSGNILVGTWSEGLYILDYQKDSLVHLLTETQVNKILIENNNQAWIATDNGLFFLNLIDYSIEFIDLGVINITELISDNEDDLMWLVGWDCGLIAVDKTSRTWKQYLLETEVKPLKTNPNNTYSILQDSKNNLWIGTWNSGLFTFNKKSEKFQKVELVQDKSNALNTNYNIILDIYEDKTQNIWIGTDSGGIVRLGNKKLFKSVSYENNSDCGLSNFHITNFWKSNDGVLYVGTRGGGLYKTTDNKTFNLVELGKGVENANLVKNIFPISKDKLWVNYDLESYELDFTKENGKLKPLHDENIGKIRKVTSFKKIGQSLIIGTQQDGLYFFPNLINTNSYKQFTPQNNTALQNERITFVEQDSAGEIWLGTFKGLYFFNSKSHEISPIHLEKNHYLTGDIMNCWHQTNDSVFWVGTPSGLNKLTKKENKTFTVEHFSPETGLIDDYILGILSSDNNELWISTSSGLVKLLINDEKVYAFDKSDGLPSLNFSESKGYLAKDGTMYFGSTDGYIYFRSEDIQINEVIPPIVFTKFKIFNHEIKPNTAFNGNVFLNRSINAHPEIFLSHKEKEFTIEFSALNYSSPQRNQYSYKLEGYDKEWVLAGTKRSVTYINLKPGDYQFKVRGSNNNYVWNMEGTSLSFNIKPAPWKSWYAIVIYVLFITGIVLLIRWNAVKQVRLANSLEMEKVQNEQAHQLNEMKLRFFTDISHEFRTPLTLILGPIKEILDENSENRRLKVVYKNAKRLMTLVNQLLEFRRIETDTLRLKASKNNIVDFTKEVCISFEELAKINNIQFNYNIQFKSKQVWFDVEKMEMILNNLISNAFKYIGSGSVVEVSLSEGNGFVCIHVIDNGSGISEEDIKLIFNRFYQSRKNNKLGSTGIGLNLVKRLVELHKGEINVESVPNVKTEFIVKLRKGEEHFTNEEKTEQSFIQSSFNAKTGIPLQLKPESHSKAFDEKRNSILIVEDNQEIREYLKELLEKEYNVDRAENGKIGYEMALENEYDLILSDVLMPEMDGIEFCKKLKTNIETSHIPVILLTAKSANQFRLEGLAYGAEAYMTKPFNPEELKVQVNTILEARQKVKERFGKIITLEPTDIEITSQEEEFIEKVIKSIEENIENSDFRSEDLARLVGTSTTTLYRKLKSLTGQSSNDIIRTIRLKRAAQLLRDSKNTISEVAYSVGFNDVKYFRKCFSKQFSSTPSDYRNRQ